jgi:formate hydrogenlyase subunit 6/NADH:ubiquinone oxidoreductase subunit I
MSPMILFAVKEVGRAKFNKQEDRVPGRDCIDCKQCVNVCPQELIFERDTNGMR